MHQFVGRAAHAAHTVNTARAAHVDYASRTLVDEATRVLMARGTSTCTNDSDPGCTKPTQVPTLAIALAIVVPVVGISIVLFFLHRRNQRKLAEEDKDKYRSMDFGLEHKGAPGGRVGVKKGPEMSVTDVDKEMKGAHSRGISLEHGSPYILPVGLHGSRESFHSLSRSNHDPHDPYRPVTFMTDNASVRSSSRAYGKDNTSLYTSSSAGTKGRNGDGLGLLQNAQRMSTSHPMRSESLSPDGSRSPIQFPDPTAMPLSPLNPRANDQPQFPASSPGGSEIKQQYAAFKPTTDVPKIMIPDADVKSKSVNKSPVEKAASFSPRIQSQQAVVSHGPSNSILSTSSYGDAFQITPPSPRHTQPTIHENPTPVAPAPLRAQPPNAGLNADDFGQNTNRLSMSLRPMPPMHDDPEENPEDRANRIRSFYKEYFDDSKPEPVGGHQYTDYHEDYSSEYLDGAVFDPQARGFVVAQPNAPFAEPITRRAMTPPPRAPPRFRSNTGGAHMSRGSLSSPQYPPRNMSSMSGRVAAPAPRKPLPPPSALSSLPTPGKLNENSMVFDAADFAPPISYRDRQNGMRPDSPLGAPRPFSPAVRPHTPLVSSYDDLAVMPSPHLLRKSGTFTALDFAPPPKFREPGSSRASDAGSIRSNRSGISNNAQYAIRNGANRVSRIPKGVVTTQDDLLNQLRPQMSLVTKA
ncbi:hypothetical protein N0V95_002016 [Ascochyta clinopodiicola]|nr:hypothetical protein N0V95_002016 [Ascochyta clinopodiicola]